jgi:methyl-accepting chemotaxis protein
VRLSVRNKLFAGFGALILLLVVSSLVSLGKLGSLNDQSINLADQAVPGVDIANRLNTAESDYRISQLQHVIATTPAQMDEQENNLAERSKLVDDAVAEYDRLLDLGDDMGIDTSTDRKMIAELAGAWKAYVDHTAPAVAHSRALENDKAMALLNGEGRDKFLAAAHAAEALVDWNQKWAAQAKKDAASAYSGARSLALLLLAVALVAGVAIAVVLSRQIKAGVSQMLTAAEGIAEGDLDQNVAPRSRDELGDTARAFGRMVEYLRETAQAADAIGAGDLTVDVEPKSDKDVLRVAMRAMSRNLSELVGELNQSAGTVSSASQQLTATSEEASKAVTEIASAIGDVAQGAESQVRRVAEVREAMLEAVNAVSESARSADEASAVAEQARETAQHGVLAVGEADAAMSAVQANSQDTARAMGELADKSQRIGEFIATITSIAEQTNLLALNAAIEAARAGEQGRGFAVVAEEVRKLAEESQQAATTISGLVQEIQSETERAVSVVQDGVRRTEQGAETVAQARTAFEAIGEAVEDMSARIEAIAAAAQQITATSERVNEDISGVATVAESSSATAEQVSASTQETSASAEEISASAQELSSTAQLLEQLVGRFKVRG